MYPTPITPENYPQAWKCIARKRYWSIKKELIRRVSVTAAQLVYFFTFAILAVGIFYEMGGVVLRTFLSQGDKIGIWWHALSDPLLEGATSEFARILRCALALYGLPLIFALVPAILIVLFYHPRTPKKTGNVEQDAWQLRSLAKHAQVYAQKKSNSTANICAAFMGMLMIAFVVGVMLFAYQNPELRESVMEKAHSASLRSFLYGAAMFFCYVIVNIPLRLLLKPLHFCHVPAAMVTDTEAFHAQLSKTENKLAD